MEVTGFYSRLWDLVVGNEDAFRFFTGPPPEGPLDADPYANGHSNAHTCRDHDTSGCGHRDNG